MTAAHNSAGQLRKGYQEVSDPSKTPGARHPMVFTDPNTNKKTLFIGRRPHAYICLLYTSDAADD